MNIDFQEILKELEYRLPHGIINLNEEHQVTMLVQILRENGVDDANELAQRARVVFGYVNEASKTATPKKKPAAKPAKQVGTKFKAFSKEGEKAVYFKTKDALDTAIKSGSHISVDQKKKNDSDKEKGKTTNQSKKQEPKQLGGSDFETDIEIKNKTKFETKKRDDKEIKQIYKSLYSKQSKIGNSVILNQSDTFQEGLDKGYVSGAWWTTPGNAGSFFNEYMSDEGVKVLEKYPDLNEEDLTKILFETARKSELGKQQVSPAFKSKRKPTVPTNITDETEKSIYLNCAIAARSARTKYQISKEGIDKAQSEGKFGKKVSFTTYGGSATKTSEKTEISKTPDGKQGDKERLISQIQKSKGKSYIYDRGVNKLFEVPKDKLVEWIKAGGGGENASDTYVTANDENGNIIFHGPSDKKTLGDIQGNSTLNYDFEQNTNRVGRLLKSNQIDEKSAKIAKRILEDNKKKVSEIEAGYKLVSNVNSKAILSLDDKGFSNLESIVSSGGDAKKYYDKFKQIHTSLMEGKTSTQVGLDDLTITMIQKLKGEKRKISKEETQYQSQLNSITKNYPEYEGDMPGLRNYLKDCKTKASLQNKEDGGCSDNLKKIEGLQKGIKAERGKYVEEFINWRTANKKKAGSITPLKLLASVASDKESVSYLTDDHRKLIERTAKVVRESDRDARVFAEKAETEKNAKKKAELKNKADENQKMRDSILGKGVKADKGFQTGKLLGDLRKQALDIHSETFKDLNKLQAKTSTGKPQRVGNLLAFQEMVDFYHLNKINPPKDDTDYHQIFTRSTTVIMEGVPVGPDTIRECLGVESLTDLENSFELEFDDAYQYDADGYISGKTQYFYCKNEGGKKQKKGAKKYRGKDGPTSPTSNTVEWDTSIQQCFDEKNPYA